MDEQFSKWWEGEKADKDSKLFKAYLLGMITKEDTETIFTAAYSLGLAKGRKEGMEWLPIETAPAGTDMLLAGVMDGPQDWRIKVGHRATDEEGGSYGFRIYGASWKPLFWMSLPCNPDAIRQAAQGGEGICENCNALLGDDAPIYEDANICRKCHNGIEEVEQSANRAAGGECCEWAATKTETNGIQNYRTGCHHIHSFMSDADCPYCGKPIHVKES